MSQGIDKNRTWPQFDKMCQNANKKFCTHQVRVCEIWSTLEIERACVKLQKLKFCYWTDESDSSILSIVSISKAGGGKGRGREHKKFYEHKLVHADFSTSYVAFSTKMVINFIMHKATLPSSPKYFGTFDAGLLLGDKGLFPFFEPEIKPD